MQRERLNPMTDLLIVVFMVGVVAVLAGYVMLVERVR
jgi:hypothetical protein